MTSGKSNCLSSSLLIPVTLGIILIWLAPYFTATTIGFYEDLKAKGPATPANPVA